MRSGHPDVVVVGLGVLGASALRELARDGFRVIGLEQFRVGHDRGSSHGRSRAVRFLYHASEYVQLLQPAIDGWRSLEAEAGRRIYWNCGTLFFARPGNTLFESNTAVMAAGGLPHEILDAHTARRRFPAFAMTEGAVGVYNEDGGMVDADAGVAAFLAGARSAGAVVREGTHVERIDTDGDGVRIETADGEIRAGRVVVAAGAWTTRLLRDLLPDAALPIRVTRQTWLTFRPDDPAPVGPGDLPVWCDYDTLFYGFPDHGPGLKIADDTPGQETDPDAPDRRGDPTEEQLLSAYLRQRFPSAGLALVERGTCLYTLTPDEDFLLGPVPGTDGRVVAAVGLNHAFKFAPVIGRILAELATAGATPHPIDRFRVDRFAPATAL